MGNSISGSNNNNNNVKKSKLSDKEREELESNYKRFDRKNSLLSKLPQHYAINQCKTHDTEQQFPKNRPNTHTFSNVGVPRMFNKGISKEEDKNEYYDPSDTLTLKIKQLASIIKSSKHIIIYTGAGISTSADLPDFRGPNGCWTKEANKIVDDTKVPSLTEIVPTFAHMAIAKLVELDIVKFVITTNMDNLHLRSGVPVSKIVELHGNSFKERCTVCKKDYYREKEIYNCKFSKCEVEGCEGSLVDTIVNFNQPIEDKDWVLAKEQSEQCDLSIVLGTSMRVLPSCLLPEMGIMKNGKGTMSICNLQITPYDDNSTPRFFCPTDNFFYYLMNELEIQVDSLTPKGEKIKEISFPTEPKSHFLPSTQIDPSVYDVDFRFLF
eukprot:gene7639-9397_t